MHVYGIAKCRYSANLSGKGTTFFGGRWNRVGTPCMYNSGSRALALLEFSVHVTLAELPRQISLVTICVPDSNVYTLSESELPANWMKSPAPPSTKSKGTKLLAAMETLVICAPSCIVPQEINNLINPRHRYACRIQLTSEEELVYDGRIKEMER